MIHHISIPAQNPRHVASVLAELFDNNYCAPFPSHPGSYITFAGDEYGTFIEVYPLGTQMLPGKGDLPIQYQHDTSSKYTATHAALSIPLEESQIKSIAQREGWRYLRCSRGHFDIIEFWVENSLLLELATPELAAQYTAVLAPKNLAQHFRGENSESIA